MMLWAPTPLRLLLPVLLLALPLAQPLQVCSSWNLHGARFKLRDYPANAGPIRYSQDHYSACYSVTLKFIASTPAISPAADTSVFRYFVFMGGLQSLLDLPCETALTAYMQAFQTMDSKQWSDVLNENQPAPRTYTYAGGWFQCCNSSDRCNNVVNPPSFVLNATERPIGSCNAFNVNSGYKFFSNPLFAGPLKIAKGNFSECFSYTVELMREDKHLYYVHMGGYDPTLYDGTSSCKDWVDSTLRSLQIDNFYHLKFNLTVVSSWASCCNWTDCNNVTVPPDSSAPARVPSPLSLTLMLVLTCVILSLS